MISRFRPTRAQGLAHFGGGPVRGRERGEGANLWERIPQARRAIAEKNWQIRKKMKPEGIPSGHGEFPRVS